MKVNISEMFYDEMCATLTDYEQSYLDEGKAEDLLEVIDRMYKALVTVCNLYCEGEKGD